MRGDGAERSAIEHVDAAEAVAAARRLAGERPEWSARRRLAPGQAAVVFAASAYAVLWARLAPDVFAVAANAAALVLFGGFSAIRWAALLRLARRRSPAPDPPLADDDLPFYTVVAPLYREPEHARRLADTLAALDYPAERREILLVCEADDEATLTALASRPPPPGARVLAVAPTTPRTKPKACAVALGRARGAFVALYDAEDAPEPDQLRKAAARFAARGPEVAALQTRLVYVDRRRSWLARQFDAEYAAQFDILLPLLSALRLPIPLGGTGNHFRAEALRAVGGWDPYNVTEDADVGYRFAAQGYRVETLDSVTEEAVVPGLRPWTAQRARWVKGYLQTLLVHTRRPVDWMKGGGFLRYAAFLMVHGGATASYFLYPAIAAVILLWAVAGVRPPFDPASALFEANVALAGFGGLAAYATLAAGAAMRGAATGARLLWLLLTAPVYRFWGAAAAVAASVEFALRPAHWRKTPHPRPGEPRA